MKVSFDENDEKETLSVNIEFDSYDPENKSLRKMVLNSIQQIIKTQICKINDELYKAKLQETKLKKEIEEKQKNKQQENK